MRNTVLLGVVVAVLAAWPVSQAFALDGIQARVDEPAHEAMRGRLMLGTNVPLHSADTSNTDGEVVKVNSLSLMGDYYLSRPFAGTTGGLRATSGVLFGQRSQVWSSPSGVSLYSVDRRSPAGSLADATSDANSTSTYLGVGYTGLSAKHGWGISADFGLMAQNPRSAVRLGRVFNGGQNLDDAVRDLGLSPVLQLGVSYAF